MCVGVLAAARVGEVSNLQRGYNLRQRAWLQFAEFDQQRGVHDIDVGGDGQLEQLSEDHLNKAFLTVSRSDDCVCSAAL